MAISNADTANQKVGIWEFFVGATSLGTIDDGDVEHNFDSSLVEGNSQDVGKGVEKVWTGGTVPTVKFTINHLDKWKLSRLYPYLTASNIDPTDGNLGGFDFPGDVGIPVTPFVLTGYFYHYKDDGTYMSTDNLNPYSFQIYRAFTTSPLSLKTSASKEAMIEVEVKGMADRSKTRKSPAKMGFVALPLAGVVFVKVTAGGSGYTSTPTVTIGTQFAATTAYTLNQQVAYLGNLYTVTVAGTSGAIGTAPVHTSGTAVSGTVTFSYAGPSAQATAVVTSNVVTSITVTTVGAGYTSAPAISFTGGAGTGAGATAYIG